MPTGKRLEGDYSYSVSAPVAHELQFLPTTWGFSYIQIHHLRSRVALQLVIIPVHVVSRDVAIFRLGRLNIVCRREPSWTAAEGSDLFGDDETGA